MDEPRPNRDTGIGVHGSSDCHNKPADFMGRIAQYKERGISWKLLFCCDQSKADWARALVDNDIMPILRLWPTFAPGLRFDIAHLEAYRDVGVKWAILGNEPNLDYEWVGELPPGKEAAYKVAESYAAKAGVVRERGMWPMTPPPSLGGNILHRQFFSYFMERIAQLGDPLEILYPGGIGLHCRTAGNPLDAQYTWYDCSADEWRWFDNVVKEYCGRSLPMANTEAFDEPDWLPKLYDGKYDWDLWRDRNLEQFKWFDPNNDGYRYPNYMLCNCFWLLKSVGFMHAWDEDGLIGNNAYDRQTGRGLETHLWQSMVGYVNWTRGDEVQPPTLPPPGPPPTTEPPALKLRVYDMDGQTKDYWWAHEKYGIRIELLEGEGWHVTQLREVSGPSGVECYIYEGSGEPAQGVEVGFYWPHGEDIKYTEPSGKAGFAYGPGSYIKDVAEGGPHWILVGGEEDCDEVDGLGMLAGTPHDHLDLVYQWGLVSPQQPEPPVEPPIEPDIPYTLKNALNERLEAVGLPPITDMRPAISQYVDHDAVGTRGLGPESLWNITFHHLPTLETCLEDDILGVAYYHTQTKGWSDIAYDFMVGSENDRGEVPTFFTGYLIHYSPQSGNGRVNKYSISVAVHGDFAEESPTAGQLDALRCIVESAEEFVGGGRGQCHPLPIIRHKDLVATDCPGNLYEVYRRHLNK